MKLISIFLLIISMLYSPTNLILTNEKIVLSIGNTATNEQLTNFKQQLLKRNIILNFDKISRQTDQKITYIKISVDCQDGFKGSVTQYLSDTKPTIGFYRVYKTDAISPFGMQPELDE